MTTNPIHAFKITIYNTTHTTVQKHIYTNQFFEVFEIFLNSYFKKSSKLSAVYVDSYGITYDLYILYILYVCHCPHFGFR